MDIDAFVAGIKHRLDDGRERFPARDMRSALVAIEQQERVIQAARCYIHSVSTREARQATYTTWRETYKEVFGRWP